MLRKAITWLACCSFVLASCSTPQTSSKVGPEFSSTVADKAQQAAEAAAAQYQGPKLDIVVPVFDPGLPEDENDYKEEGIWPELRRAEANRFAVKLKEALERTGAFGAVRVTPDTTATGDLYVVGRIDESNGEEVAISIQVSDISGELWYEERYDHEVSEQFHKNIRNKGLDPYQPVFDEAAEELVEELEDFDFAELEQLQSLAEIRFAANFSEEAFAEYLEVDGNEITLTSLPSDADPMLQRIRAVRIRDQLFVDGLQTHYEEFNVKMEESYALWQEQSLQEVKAQREASNKAILNGILGALAIAAAIAAGTAAANTDSEEKKAAGNTGAVIAGVGGVALIASSFQTSKEAEFHHDTMDELGESINIELAPQVVEFDETTEEITGDAAEQFAQWRAFLKRMYDLERTPAKKL
ncbi:hypothetical protein NBZ79_02805 [Sneathiella marina]|uniref:Lipoprotein n=1 Tax=Sneathiella marina TaxID=2950108 RepID=A0ABY4W3X6_9PROT|nr:hypothetical protein [Sneathiella marina]USG61902.1 hypothetical protein NBZ79_02805 [Sneathiella marina]